LVVTLSSAWAATPGGKGSLIVNINTATATELQSLPNVGPAIAIRIIAGRPYKSSLDLARISGISRSQARELSKFAVVAGKTRKIEY
jgi:DNA uptake protein ComE-like DNA-binding protein